MKSRRTSRRRLQIVHVGLRQIGRGVQKSIVAGEECSVGGGRRQTQRHVVLLQKLVMPRLQASVVAQGPAQWILKGQLLLESVSRELELGMNRRSWRRSLVNVDLLPLDLLAEMTLAFEEILVKVAALVTSLGYASEPVPVDTMKERVHM